eukprot:TRINITY_DN21156_c0_g1_i1.p1 TRINITY_DN21156_c0_g1~~TRINITY_DN21156_c0_g1_i1.p1  ORF type:complete len:1417 (+),score=318.69 TRINITY_DN21156_c0_g1_i1:55-4305(+)
MSTAAAKAKRDRALRQQQQKRAAAQIKLAGWTRERRQQLAASDALHRVFDADMSSVCRSAFPSAASQEAALRQLRTQPQQAGRMKPTEVWRLCVNAAVLNRGRVPSAWGSDETLGLAAVLSAALKRPDSTPLQGAGLTGDAYRAQWQRTVLDVVEILAAAAECIVDGADEGWSPDTRFALIRLLSLVADFCEPSAQGTPKVWATAAAAAVAASGAAHAKGVLVMAGELQPKLRSRLSPLAVAVLSLPAPREVESPLHAIAAARLAAAAAMPSACPPIPALHCCPCLAEAWGDKAMIPLSAPALWRRVTAAGRLAVDGEAPPDMQVWGLCNTVETVAACMRRLAEPDSGLMQRCGELCGVLATGLPRRSILNSILSDDPQLERPLRALHRNDPAGLGFPEWAQEHATAQLFFAAARMPYDPFPEGRGPVVGKEFTRLSDGRSFHIEPEARSTFYEVWSHGPRVRVLRIDELPGNVVEFRTEDGAVRRWDCRRSAGTSTGGGEEWKFALWRPKKDRRKDQRQRRERREVVAAVVRERQLESDRAAELEKRQREDAERQARREQVEALSAAEAAARASNAASAVVELDALWSTPEAEAVEQCRLVLAQVLAREHARESVEATEGDHRYAVVLQQHEAWRWLCATPTALQLRPRVPDVAAAPAAAADDAAAARAPAAQRHAVVIEGLPRNKDRGSNAALRRLLDSLGLCAVHASIAVQQRRRTGHAVAQFDSAAAAESAAQTLDGTSVFSKTVRCRVAEPNDFTTGVLSHTWAAAAEESEHARPHARHQRPVHVAVVNSDRCQRDRCAQECRRVCPSSAVELPAEGGPSVISEKLCIGCGSCQKKATSGCPFNAIQIHKLPVELSHLHATHRYGANGFILYRLPVPRPGEALGIVGANGTGKSTALRILSGGLVPNLDAKGAPPGWAECVRRWRGSALQPLLEGFASGTAQPSVKPQHIHPFAAQLGEGTNTGDLLRASDERGVLGEVARQLELTPLYGRALGELSGGELQRVCVALCAVRRAGVYLFDEPSSFLDVRQRIRAAKVIRGAADAAWRPYCLVVEHDLALLDFASDQVCVVHGKAGCYGVTSRPLGCAAGVNAFMEGRLQADNVRFRDRRLTFRIGPDDDDDWKPGDVLPYPAMTKDMGGFRLSIDAGTLQEGTVVVLMGQNGTGKTTFVKILAGLESAEQGGGLEVLRQRRVSVKEQRPRIAAPHQGATAAEALAEGLPGGSLEDPLWRSAVYDPLRLADIVDLKAESLSGGEIQRVALARCLAAPADVYLIDEPSAYLDAEMRMAVAAGVRRFARHSGRAVAVVEHDLMMAHALADSVVIFEGVPAAQCVARAPAGPQPTFARFLRNLGLTVRVDGTTGRPRINKPGSRLDKLQRHRDVHFNPEGAVPAAAAAADSDSSSGSDDDDDGAD